MTESAFNHFFFLRPLWLLGALICLVAMVYLYRKTSSKSGWWELMDNNIGQSLILASGSHKLMTPLNLLLVLVAAGCLAMAGPTNSKQLPDELKDRASVIVLMANSDSMYAGDVTPNRNRVAKQKIRALRQRLAGSQFGLAAYAYSAHQVAPLTSDPQFLDLYLSPLEPKLMPDREQKTSGLHDGLKLAAEMMANARYPANILILADQLSEQDVSDIVDFRQARQSQQTKNLGLQVLAIGTENGGTLRFVEAKEVEGEPDTRMPLSQFAALKQQGIDMLGVTQNDDDVEWLAKQIKRSVTEANNRNPDFKWKDSGYLLAFLLIPVCLLLFRKKSWLFSMAPFALASFMLLGSVCFSPVAYAIDGELEDQTVNSEKMFSQWDQLWWSPDQLGQKALERGDYVTAAEQFEDPYLKGWSLYQTGDYKAAEVQLRKVENGDGYFYLANTLAMQQKYKEALSFYGKSIELKGQYQQAESNVAIVKSLMAKANKVSANERQVKDEGQIILQVGAKGRVEKKQSVFIDPLIYSEEELKVWLGKVKSSPEKLLKTKFELQSQEKMLDAL